MAVGQQSGAGVGQGVAAAKVSLAEVVARLPDFVDMKLFADYEGALDNATVAERDAAVPGLVNWSGDERPKVRAEALLTLGLLYMPATARPAAGVSVSLPVQYLPAVAAHLLDADVSVRRTAFLALQPTLYSGVGEEELVTLVLPMLRDPDALTEYPDPSFVESDQYLLSKMTPEQQAAYKAVPRKVIRLPAKGSLLLPFLMGPRLAPSTRVDDALVAFLDRKDQTGSTIAECLHTVALSAADARVNDEALRRVFELKAMNVFLLQFVGWLRLTAEQREVERGRLVALSEDATVDAGLRRAAREVAACWTGENRSCRPRMEDMREPPRP